MSGSPALRGIGPARKRAARAHAPGMLVAARAAAAFVLAVASLNLLAACLFPIGSGDGGTAAAGLHAIAPDPAATLANAAGWERRNAAFYHVWVSAFADSDSDGSGDLAGITARIEEGYFSDLGVNALWLSPVFEAASLSAASGNKHGYDTVDYGAVAPIYGDETALRTLLQAAHVRGIRVIFDFTPNHSSDRHPWFADPGKRDWYAWRETRPSGWTGFDSWSDWHGSGPYYYGVFGPGMPDLNYRDEALRAAMRNVAIDWLNFGFDGMRIDAVKYLYEGPADGQWKDQDETIAWFRALRSEVLDAYSTARGGAGSAKFMIAENWEGDLSNVRRYLQDGSSSGFHASLDFIWPYVLAGSLDGSGAANRNAALLRHLVDETNSLPREASFGVFQSNHDNVVSRPATVFQGDGGRIYLAAALSILGKGIPFVYYGNEIGMIGEAGNDLNLRAPFEWTSAAAQRLDPDSLWSWHSELLRARTDYEAWADPEIAALATDDSSVLAFMIAGETGARAVVVANTSASGTDGPVSVDLPAPGASSATAILGDGTGSSASGSQLTVAVLPGYVVRVFALDDADAVSYRPSDAKADAFRPALPQLYLRGTFNDWAAGPALAYQGGGLYVAEMGLQGGSQYAFKFGSADWSTALGWDELAYDASRGSLSAELLGPDASGYRNIALVPPETGTWRFWLDPIARLFWILKAP